MELAMFGLVMHQQTGARHWKSIIILARGAKPTGQQFFCFESEKYFLEIFLECWVLVLAYQVTKSSFVILYELLPSEPHPLKTHLLVLY